MDNRPGTSEGLFAKDTFIAGNGVNSQSSGSQVGNTLSGEILKGGQDHLHVLAHLDAVLSNVVGRRPWHWLCEGDSPVSETVGEILPLLVTASDSDVSEDIKSVLRWQLARCTSCREGFLRLARNLRGEKACSLKLQLFYLEAVAPPYYTQYPQAEEVPGSVTSAVLGVWKKCLQPEVFNATGNLALCGRPDGRGSGWEESSEDSFSSFDHYKRYWEQLLDAEIKAELLQERSYGGEIIFKYRPERTIFLPGIGDTQFIRDAVIVDVEYPPGANSSRKLLLGRNDLVVCKLKVASDSEACTVGLVVTASMVPSTSSTRSPGRVCMVIPKVGNNRGNSECLHPLVKNQPIVCAEVKFNAAPAARRYEALSSTHRMPKVLGRAFLTPSLWAQFAFFEAQSTALDSLSDTPKPSLSQSIQHTVIGNRVQPGQVEPELTRAQEEVVAAVIAGHGQPGELTHFNAIRVVHGPPGTGKSRVLLALCDVLLQKPGQLGRIESRIRIFVGAPSNAAVDVLHDRFADHWQRSSGPGKQTDRNTVTSRAPTWVRVGHPDRMTTEKSRESAISQRNTNDQPDVVFATLSGSGNARAGFSAWHFDYVFIDEAAHCPEPDILIPLMMQKNPAAKLILFGDEKQLPPTVISRDERVIKGMKLSFFGRLQKALQTLNEFYHHDEDELQSETVRQEVPSSYVGHFLDEQFRMHPDISEFSRVKFYGGKLRDGVSADTQSKWYHTFPWIDSARCGEVFGPVTILNMDEISDNKERKVRTSFVNDKEVEVVLDLILILLRKRLENISPFTDEASIEADIHSLARSITVVTPYKSQEEELGLQLRKFLEDTFEDFLPEDAIQVRTVDAMQGSENDIIILSTVRTNIEGRIGFLDSQERFNVVATRAQNSFIVVGSVMTLSANSRSGTTTSSRNSNSTVWRDFVLHCQKKSWVTSAALILPLADEILRASLDPRESIYLAYE